MCFHCASVFVSALNFVLVFSFYSLLVHSSPLFLHRHRHSTIYITSRLIYCCVLFFPMHGLFLTNDSQFIFGQINDCYFCFIFQEKRNRSCSGKWTKYFLWHFFCLFVEPHLVETFTTPTFFKIYSVNYFEFVTSYIPSQPWLFSVSEHHRGQSTRPGHVHC